MYEKKLKPGERIDLLRDDLTDTNAWLEDKYPSDHFALMVDYYHHQKFTKEVAYVVILGPAQEKRRAVRAVATRALEAFGWRIMPEGGGDVIDSQPYPTSDLSAHQRLRSIARVKTALNQAKQPN
ncbi:hypothetical protein [Sulfitobacter guttiformis]|jgi:hypothetical protein|uniref:Uncharacterized protein n=1 Tax=Sulfitobacter guttiformis TaxID=74349 RepID=A0A420DRS9_9RHOB|nr:hypothetical protein [Sulfitobacter guttiformis]KIN74245.1 hypothetical protein Z949_3441 [Sulfitobacter guttiformis KCTC 32187]RKE96849.1 hypothetical protein C8N30_1423 [Sulfitobacter guttiformis]